MPELTSNISLFGGIFDVPNLENPLKPEPKLGNLSLTVVSFANWYVNIGLLIKIGLSPSAIFFE